MLEDEKTKDSEFYRLSPLLFKLFDMREEFERRKHELMQGADQPYRDWLEDLSSRQRASFSELTSDQRRAAVSLVRTSRTMSSI